MFLKLLIASTALTLTQSASYPEVFTFKNVVLTCDSPSEDENPFATYVTSNTLHTHLPNGQKCFKLSVEYANLPVLRKGSVSEIDNVNYLVLENDNIEEIEPGAFENLKVKEGLSLKSNRIREIRRGVFNEVRVPVLFLSYNSITYIDYKAFDNMTSLESLHLDHNKISRINSFWFRNTPKLNKIDLQYNQIQELQRFAFQNLDNENFKTPRIDLSHNFITNVDADALGGLKKLQFLSLAYNRLVSLNEWWLRGIKINILDISHNRIRCLRGGLAEPYSTNLVGNNPWDCRCLEELKKKECKIFGRINANECNLPSNDNCL